MGKNKVHIYILVIIIVGLIVGFALAYIDGTSNSQEAVESGEVDSVEVKESENKSYESFVSNLCVGICNLMSAGNNEEIEIAKNNLVKFTANNEVADEILQVRKVLGAASSMSISREFSKKDMNSENTDILRIITSSRYKGITRIVEFRIEFSSDIYNNDVFCSVTGIKIDVH